MAAFQTTSAGVGIADSLTPVESDAETGVFRARYDSSRDSTSLAVVAAVATADNRDPFELAPLQFSIDTDALDALLAEPITIGRGCTKTTFCYEGFEVTVFGDGLIEAAPIENT